MCRSQIWTFAWCCSLVFLAACASHVASPPRPNVEEQVRWLTPGLEPDFEPAATVAPPPYSLHSFTYGQAPGWPYGRGFAVESSTTGAVLWIYLHHGDYPPHRLRWADFDGDGRQDILFHAGEEDEFYTAVYLNRVVAERFGVSHFVRGHENVNAYAIVLDFAGDGHPELIIPEPYAEASDECANEFRQMELDDDDARETYMRLTGPFNEFNVTFGYSDDEVAGLALFDRIAVVTFDRSSDSEPRRGHLRWRIAKLRDARGTVTPSCRDRVDETIDHLEWLLRQ